MINKYRIKWHHYHLSEMKGKYYWRYCIYDLSKSYELGRLTSRIEVKNSEGVIVGYRLEAARRGTNVIFIQYAEEQSNEEPMVEIFPLMGKHYLSPYFGMMYIESWDGTQILSPSIISNKKLFDRSKIGNIDAETGDKLSELWKENFKKRINIFPLTTD